MRCHKCGKEVGTVAYCPYCGEKTGRWVKAGKRLFAAVLLAVVILGMIPNVLGAQDAGHSEHMAEQTTPAAAAIRLSKTQERQEDRGAVGAQVVLLSSRKNTSKPSIFAILEDCFGEPSSETYNEDDFKTVLIYEADTYPKKKVEKFIEEMDDLGMTSFLHSFSSSGGSKVFTFYADVGSSLIDGKWAKKTENVKITLDWEYIKKAEIFDEADIPDEPEQEAVSESSVVEKKCSWCGGDGKCRTCGGKGYQRKWVSGTVREYVRQNCTDCSIPGKCRYCNGKGTKYETETTKKDSGSKTKTVTEETTAKSKASTNKSAEKSTGKTTEKTTQKTTKKTTEETVKATEAKSEKDTYAEAVSAYNRGSYSTAKKLFQEVSSYGDSSKYLRLIRIRNAGSNIGVGSKVYQSACGLTDSDKQDIDDAARDFYFADTAEVLVCNSDVASYYLIGEWNGGSKCYIHFIANNYGCRYNIGSKLSTNYQDTFAINDGIVTVDVVGSCAKTLKLTLTSPDCMEVYTYEKGGKCYTLNR